MALTTGRTNVRQLYELRPPSAYVRTLEALSKVANLVLVAYGFFIVGYCSYVVARNGSDEPSSNTCWELYAFAATALILAIIALLALLGISIRNQTCLSSSIILLCTSGAMQTCLAVDFTVNQAWSHLLPSPTSAQQARQLVLDHLSVFKWLGVAFSILQVVVLVLGWLLQSLYSSALEDQEDLAAEGAARTPLLADSSSHRSSRSQPVALPGRVARSDNWSRDMQERYGLDTSTFSYDPEQQQAGRQGLGSQQDGPPQLTRSKQSRCVVM